MTRGLQLFNTAADLRFSDTTARRNISAIWHFSIIAPLSNVAQIKPHCLRGSSRRRICVVGLASAVTIVTLFSSKLSYGNDRVATPPGLAVVRETYIVGRTDIRYDRKLTRSATLSTSPWLGVVSRYARAPKFERHLSWYIKVPYQTRVRRTHTRLYILYLYILSIVLTLCTIGTYLWFAGSRHTKIARYIL